MAQVPTTAVINPTTAAQQVKVNFNGTPEWAPITGTTMSYATNTPNRVIQVGSVYYLCLNGVWFMSNTPNGPWQTAPSVPPEIYTIPASSPVYNVTYVTQTTLPDGNVQASYTAGYMGTLSPEWRLARLLPMAPATTTHPIMAGMARIRSIIRMPQPRATIPSTTHTPEPMAMAHRPMVRMAAKRTGELPTIPTPEPTRAGRPLRDHGDRPQPRRLTIPTPARTGRPIKARMPTARGVIPFTARTALQPIPSTRPPRTARKPLPTTTRAGKRLRPARSTATARRPRLLTAICTPGTTATSTRTPAPAGRATTTEAGTTFRSRRSRAPSRRIRRGPPTTTMPRARADRAMSIRKPRAAPRVMLRLSATIRRSTPAGVAATVG